MYHTFVNPRNVLFVTVIQSPHLCLFVGMDSEGLAKDTPPANMSSHVLWAQRNLLLALRQPLAHHVSWEATPRWS